MIKVLSLLQAGITAEDQDCLTKVHQSDLSVPSKNNSKLVILLNYLNLLILYQFICYWLIKNLKSKAISN